MSVFEHTAFADHERVIFHQHRASGLKAIIAIHNRNLGPAVGGCRMLPYITDDEALIDVLRLSRGMTYKCALASIPFGGGKAVIMGDPSKHKTRELLLAMGDFVEMLKGDYIAAFDAGTTLDDLRVMANRSNYIAGISEGFANASGSTAQGVFIAIKAAAKYRLQADSLVGIRVAVQGLGNVGLRLVRLLLEAGAEVIATDVNHQHLQRVVDELGIQSVRPEAIYELAADVFCPCALGAVINAETLPQLSVSCVVGGANNQLLSDQYADELRVRNILYAPDYVVNAGGIIDLYYQLNSERLGASIHTALPQHLNRIADTLRDIFIQSERKNCSTAAVADQMAEQRFLAR